MLSSLKALGHPVIFIGESTGETHSRSVDMEGEYGITAHTLPENRHDACKLLMELSDPSNRIIHIFSNPHGDPIYRHLWRYAHKKGINFAFAHALPGAFSSPIGKLARNIYYKLLALGPASKASFILCHGLKCREYIEKSGFPSNRILPWGYFHVSPWTRSQPPKQFSNKFVFIGRLVRL